MDADAMDGELWARAIGAGLDDATFWRITPAELSRVFAVRREQARAAALNAALVAAVVTNVHLRKGARPVQPVDFLHEPRKASDYMTVAEAQRILGAFATRHPALPT